MNDSQIRILGVGDRQLLDNLNFGLNEESKGRISIPETAIDITDALNKLKQGKYKGLLLTTLALPSGED